MAGKFHIPLTTDHQAVAVELQGALIDLLDLTLIGKHAHWNAEGAHFRSVHHELDELVDAWRALSDEVAERAATIGAAPDGQAQTIAGATQLEPLPTGHLSVPQVLRGVGDRLAEVAFRTRKRIDRVAADDPVTCDLLVRVAGRLEKQLWMMRVQLPGAEHVARRAVAARADDADGADRL
jgi:starvation-inducible DNA-binding protein